MDDNLFSQLYPSRTSGIGSSANWKVYSDSKPTLESSRETVKIELGQKIVYNHPSVYERLRLDGVANSFVDECLAAFTSQVGNEQTKLQALENRSEVKSERDMYKPIVEVCS